MTLQRQPRVALHWYPSAPSALVGATFSGSMDFRLCSLNIPQHDPPLRVSIPSSQLSTVSWAWRRVVLVKTDARKVLIIMSFSVSLVSSFPALFSSGLVFSPVFLLLQIYLYRSFFMAFQMSHQIQILVGFSFPNLISAWFDTIYIFPLSHPVHVVFMLEFNPLLIQGSPHVPLLDFLLARMDLWLGGDPSVTGDGKQGHQCGFQTYKAVLASCFVRTVVSTPVVITREVHQCDVWVRREKFNFILRTTELELQIRQTLCISYFLLAYLSITDQEGKKF